MKRILLIGIGGLILAGLLVTYFLWWAPGPKRVAHDVLVPEGATLGTVSRQLAKEGAIPGSARTYYVMARIFGSHDPIQAGEFSIPKGMGGAAILDLLQHGKPTQRLITVVPGMPSIVIAEKLASNPYLSGSPAVVAEGTVLPDSYGFQRGETRAVVAILMQRSMARAIDALWPKRDYVCPLATKEQAVTLASIVEKETGKPSDRPELSKDDPKGLIAALKSDNMFWRLNAQRLLVERGKADVKDDLLRIIEQDTSRDALGLSPAVIHALWAASGLGVLGGDEPSLAGVSKEALQAYVRFTQSELAQSISSKLVSPIQSALLQANFGTMDRDQVIDQVVALEPSLTPNQAVTSSSPSRPQ